MKFAQPLLLLGGPPLHSTADLLCVCSLMGEGGAPLLKLRLRHRFPSKSDDQISNFLYRLYFVTPSHFANMFPSSLPSPRILPSFSGEGAAMTRGNKSSGGRQSAAAAAAAGSRHAAPVVSVISINFHVPSVLHMCNVLEASLLLLLLLHVVALCRRQDHAHARRATTCRMHEQKAVEEELAACDVEPGSIDRPNPFFLFLTEARLTTASPIFECVCAVVFLHGPVQSTPAAPSYCIHYTPHHRVCDRRRRRCPRPAPPARPTGFSPLLRPLTRLAYCIVNVVGQDDAGRGRGRQSRRLRRPDRI